MKTHTLKISIWGIILICLFTGTLFSSVKLKYSESNEIILPKCIFIADMEMTTPFYTSAVVEKLKSDVATLKSTIDTYITSAQALDKDLVIVIRGLELIDKVATDLKVLDQVLTTVNQLLDVAKLIPQTKTEAQALSDGINVIKPQVSQASKVANKYNDEFTPFRGKLETFDEKLKSLIQKTQAFERKLDAYVVHISNAQQCINSLPEGTAKNDLQSRLDNLSSSSDQRVVQANRYLQDIISTVNYVENEIQIKIKGYLEPLHDLEIRIDDLLGKLNLLINPLHDLQGLYLKHFSVSFPYPSPTWKNPFRMKTYTLSIGFDIIIKGIDEIEREIERLLSKALLKAAKLFGLEKLIKDLMAQAQRELDAILNQLMMKFKVEIPGLDQLELNLKGLKMEFDLILPKIDIDTQPLEDLLNAIELDIIEMENIYNNCRRL